MCQRVFTYQYYVKNYEIINLNNKNNADNISTICAISRFLIISLQYLYPLENIDFTLFFAIYLLIYSIFTPSLSQYFQFGYFFFFLFFFCQFNLYYIYFYNYIFKFSLKREISEMARVYNFSAGPLVRHARLQE